METEHPFAHLPTPVLRSAYGQVERYVNSGDWVISAWGKPYDNLEFYMGALSALKAEMSARSLCG